MYTMEDLWFHALENEQDMPETKLARLKCASAFEYQGFLMGFRAALGLIYNIM